MSMKILGVDIGGTNIRAGLVDEQGNVTGFEKLSSSQLLSSRESISEFINFLQHFINKTVKVIVLGIPGTLNRDRSRVLSCPNLPALNGCDLPCIVGRELGLPVFLERDVNLLLLHDMQEFGSDGLVIGCYIGTGLGNGIACDGVILSGKDGVAGELGHIPIIGNNEPCTCGNRGCLENYASGRYLEKLASEQFENTPVREIFIRHGGDPRLIEYVNILAAAVSIEINILNPDRVILGGGVLDMDGFPKESLRSAIFDYVRKPLPAENLCLCFAKSSPYAGIIGASALGMQKLKERGLIL